MTEAEEWYEALWEILCTELEDLAEQINRNTPTIESGTFDRRVKFSRTAYQLSVEIYPFMEQLTWVPGERFLKSDLIERTATVAENKRTLSSTGWRPFITIDGDEFWRKANKTLSASELARSIIHGLQRRRTGISGPPPA